PASARRRWRTSSVREGEPSTSNRSCTAVATLLTFCPPGPDARTKRSSTSESSIATASLMISGISRVSSTLGYRSSVIAHRSSHIAHAGGDSVHGDQERLPEPRIDGVVPPQPRQQRDLDDV